MEVWHVRHGERCDEVSGAERRGWETSKVFGQGRGYYDSPLTKYGHVQASRAGLYIKSVLPCDREPDGDSSGLSFDRVYTSPLMRAVQTAVCVSQALGNLPLQVVPGLCSCTAALARVGYARVKLLADADIAAAFPEVNLLPRDPLAPTSFGGAQAWLAARPERRVLAVGHREGTKAMVGSRVPTPHCCIGIFNVDRTEKTYTLRHLLSLAGKPLVSKRSSSVAAAATAAAAAAAPSAAAPPSPPPLPLLQGDAPAAGDDDETAEVIAAHVIALSNTTRYNGSNDSRRVKPAAKPRRSDSGTDAAGRTIKAPAASDRTARDRLRWLLLGARAKATPRKPRSSTGIPPTPLATGKSRGGAGGGSPVVVGASGAKGINGASGVANVANGEESGESGASAETRVKAGRRPLPTTRQTGCGDRATNGYSHASSEVAAAATHAKADVDAMNGDGTARSRPLLPESHCHADDDPAAAAAAATARSNRGAVAREDRGKPLASAVATPARGGCAGRGFRVAALSRRSLSGASSANARRLGVAVDVLSGPMGVLSFLSPFELCVAQALCKDIAITATGEILWTNLFSLLPGRRRCRVTPRGEPETAEAKGATGSSKALFVAEVSARAAVHASQVAGHVARSKQKSTAIYCLRRSVDKIRMKLSVRLNGKPANLVDTRGSRAQGWASRANLLTEPSSCGGVRRFSLSSSVKVEVPEGLAPSRVLPSMSLAGSWEMAWSPLVPMVRTDRPLLLSQARLLGTDTHGGVALYEVTGLDGPGARKGGGGYSHGGGGGGGGGGGSGGGGAGGGRGGREDGDNSVLLPTKRACSLLGVFDDAEWAGQCPSGRVAFLSVHFPHDLLIDAATDRLLMSERPPGVPRFDENVSVFSVALGLRTAGCPLWEKESKDVSARRCSRNGATCLHRRGSGSEGEDRSVMRIDLVRPGENEGKELTLSGDLALPYSTSGGLYGAVEDVLLADFALCDSDGVTVWAFASPIVFEASYEAGGMGTGNSSGGGSDEDDGIIDITYSEVRVERRRGVVVEPGVGRVIVELALVVDFEGSGISGKAAILNRRFPSKHVWVVRVARAELEPSFVTTWMGQDVVE